MEFITQLSVINNGFKIAYQQIEGVTNDTVLTYAISFNSYTTYSAQITRVTGSTGTWTASLANRTSTNCRVYTSASTMTCCLLIVGF